MFSLEIRGTVYQEVADIKGCHCKQSSQDFEGVISPFYHPKMTDIQGEGGYVPRPKGFLQLILSKKLFISVAVQKSFSHTYFSKTWGQLL